MLDLIVAVFSYDFFVVVLNAMGREAYFCEDAITNLLSYSTKKNNK